jgi:hypothetical protein
MPTQQVPRSQIVVMANAAVSAVHQIRAKVGLACVRADARFKAVTGKTNQASPCISDMIIDLVERRHIPCSGTSCPFHTGECYCIVYCSRLDTILNNDT